MPFVPVTDFHQDGGDGLRSLVADDLFEVVEIILRKFFLRYIRIVRWKVER
jgi:hypothetical protein